LAQVHFGSFPAPCPEIHAFARLARNFQDLVIILILYVLFGEISIPWPCMKEK